MNPMFKFMGVCVETNPKSNSNPSDEIFWMLGTKIMNNYFLKMSPKYN